MRRACLILGSAALALVAAAPAQGAVTIGPDPLPQRTSVISTGGATIFATGELPNATVVSPIDGVVVRWRVRRGSGPGLLAAETIDLRLLRETGTADEFTAVGSSDPQAVPQSTADPIDIHEFPTQLPIEAGDRIGLGTSASQFPNRETAGSSYLHLIAPLAEGESALFETGSFSDRHVLINADVEPDCDEDGLGDETQDQEIPALPICGFTPPPTPAPPPVGLPVALPDTTAPVGSRLRFAPRRFRVMAKRSPSIATASAAKPRRKARRTSLVTYRLTEPATVRFVVKRWLFGRKKNNRCVVGKRAKRLPNAKPCRRLVRVKGAFRDAGRPGVNRFRFSGFIRGRALRPGAYRLVAVPFDAAGNRGDRFRRSFRIVR